jgi:hypothetical protein
VIIRRSAGFGPRVTRLRVLRRGWGRFATEEVTIGDLDTTQTPSNGGTVLDLDEILDVDDEDADTGLPYERERPN